MEQDFQKKRLEWGGGGIYLVRPSLYSSTWLISMLPTAAACQRGLMEGNWTEMDGLPLAQLPLGAQLRQWSIGGVALVSCFSRQYTPSTTILLQAKAYIPSKPCYPTPSRGRPEVLLGAGVHLASRVDSYLVRRPRCFVREHPIR